MDPIFYIIFGTSAALVAVWLVADTIRRARERGELRREVYLKELERAASESAEEKSDDGAPPEERQ